MVYKQVILVRSDLKLPKGKLAAQAAHASLEAAMKSPRPLVEDWRREGGKKVVLEVKDIEELQKYKAISEKEKLACALIVDAGHTTIPSGTITCLGIGPEKEERIDKVTGSLKIL